MGQRQAKFSSLDCTVVGTLNALGILRVHAQAKADVIRAKISQHTTDLHLVYAVAGRGIKDGDDDERRYIVVAFQDEEHFHTVMLEISDSNLTQGDSGRDILNKVLAEQGDKLPGEYFTFKTLQGMDGLVSARYIRNCASTYERVPGGHKMSVHLGFDWPHYNTFDLYIPCWDLRDLKPITAAVYEAMGNVKSA